MMVVLKWCKYLYNIMGIHTSSFYVDYSVIKIIIRKIPKIAMYRFYRLVSSAVSKENILAAAAACENVDIF